MFIGLSFINEMNADVGVGLLSLSSLSLFRLFARSFILPVTRMTYDLIHRVGERKRFTCHVQPSSEPVFVPITTETVLQLPASEAYTTSSSCWPQPPPESQVAEPALYTFSDH